MRCYRSDSVTGPTTGLSLRALTPPTHRSPSRRSSKPLRSDPPACVGRHTAESRPRHGWPCRCPQPKAYGMPIAH